MNVILWTQIGLVAFDALMLAILYFCLRAYAPLDRRTLLAMLAGLAGFIFQAFLSFRGIYLILLLTTYAGAALVYLLMSRRSAKKNDSR